MPGATPERATGKPRGLLLEELALGPLPYDDTLALSQALLGTTGRDSATLARESMGSPFFVHELVRFVTGPGLHADSAPQAASLESLLSARIAALSPNSRRMLEVVALGGPLRASSACRAADLEAGEGSRALAELKSASLIRARPSEAEGEFEPYHDRVRETVVGLLAHAAAGVHRSVGEALEAAGDTDPERLYDHFRYAGDRTRACVYAERAAERAMDALAFDRAASLYGEGLKLAPAAEWPMYLKHAEALARAGRGRDAGEAFLRTREHAPAEKKPELARSAAEQFLRSGHMDRGLTTLGSVLTSAGLSLPSTPTSALASLLYHRARLRLRGLRFKERDESGIPPGALARIDACWTAGLGLGNTDMVRGMDFLSRHLLAALEVGEPYRVSRGLAIEAVFTAGGGRRAVARAEALAVRAHGIAERLQHPHARSLVALARGTAAFCKYDLPRSRDLFRESLHILGEHGSSGGWEVGTAQFFLLFTLELLGELRTIEQVYPVAVASAQERGDLYSETTLRCSSMRSNWLVADRPDHARDELRVAMDAWTTTDFTLQHAWAVWAKADIALYAGDDDEGFTALAACAKTINRSQLLRIESIRFRWWEAFARAALATATGPNRARRIRLAARLGRALTRGRTGLSDAYAQLILAGVAHRRGDRDRAIALLAEAERRAATLDMKLYAAVARRRRGHLLGGDEGGVLVKLADDWMAGQNVRNPERLTAMLAPGFD